MQLDDGLNNQELKFPCHYPIKVMGLATDAFKKSVLAVFYKYIPKLHDDTISYKKSRNEKYLSISLDFYAENREQVQALYQELAACTDVVLRF